MIGPHKPRNVGSEKHFYRLLELCNLAYYYLGSMNESNHYLIYHRILNSVFISL